MRSVALDLGRKISFCEVANGEVKSRGTARSIDELERQLGPGSLTARVAFEACREGWYIHRRLREWGHEPLMVDTTRCRQLGIGQHKKKNDRIDAEVLARAVERGTIPLAHVLTPARQQLRMQLGIRRALVKTRAGYVASIRSLARAHGQSLPPCTVHSFAERLRKIQLAPTLAALIEPLLVLIEELNGQLAAVEQALEALSDAEPVVQLLRTAPGVGAVVSTAFVSVIDDAHRFESAHQVEAYLGLVPSENTSVQRRLGAITREGNRYLRALLIEAAWSIFKHKNADDPLRAWALSLAARRGKRVAVVGLARRLVGVMWALWRDGTVYEPARVGLASARGHHEHAQSLETQAVALAAAALKVRRARRKTGAAPSGSCSEGLPRA
jgi:transposase